MLEARIERMIKTCSTCRHFGFWHSDKQDYPVCRNTKIVRKVWNRLSTDNQKCYELDEERGADIHIAYLLGCRGRGKWHLVRFSDETHRKLKEQKKIMRMQAMEDVVKLALKTFLGEYDIATRKNMMSGTVPIVLTGQPEAGKTFFVRHQIIPRITNPHSVLVIDTANEYNELPKVGFEINLTVPNQKMRFVPSEIPTASEGEIASLFIVLNFKRMMLSNWVIVIEEAHRYKDIKEAMGFVYESRKFCRKVIVVTPDAKVFKGLKTLVVHREV